MKAFEKLLVETDGPIEVLTLNRPERRNALDVALIDELSRYFTELHARLDVRVVILRSTGKDFSAGADLDSTAFAAPGPGRAQRQMAMQKRYSNVVRLMRSCPQPIICVIQGAACGGSFSLVLATDVRIATPDARMNAAYLRVGLGSCDMGSSYLLPRLVGLSRASELLLTGRFIMAQRAKEIGLVSEVLPAEQAMVEAFSIANDMLKGSPMGLRLTKDGINMGVDAASLETALSLEDRQQALLTETADHREAVAAFRERRKPSYKDE